MPNDSCDGKQGTQLRLASEEIVRKLLVGGYMSVEATPAGRPAVSNLDPLGQSPELDRSPT